jgi:tol-pal system protein YbgF
MVKKTYVFAMVFNGLVFAAHGARFTSQQADLLASLSSRMGQLEEEVRFLRGQNQDLMYQMRQGSPKSLVASSGHMSSGAVSGTPKPSAADMGLPNDPLYRGPNSTVKPLSMPGLSSAQSPQALNLGSGNHSVSAEDQYKLGYNWVKEKKYVAAQRAFKIFMERYPTHSLASNALYWLGETHYVEGQYREAAKYFLQGYKKYPKAPKLTSHMMKLAYSLSRLGEKAKALALLKELLTNKKYILTPAMREQAEREKKALG